MNQPRKNYTIYQREYFLKEYLRREKISRKKLAKKAVLSKAALWRADKGYSVGNRYVGNFLNATRKDFNDVFYIAEDRG